MALTNHRSKFKTTTTLLLSESTTINLAYTIAFSSELDIFYEIKQNGCTYYDLDGSNTITLNYEFEFDTPFILENNIEIGRNGYLNLNGIKFDGQSYEIQIYGCFISLKNAELNDCGLTFIETLHNIDFENSFISGNALTIFENRLFGSNFKNATIVQTLTDAAEFVNCIFEYAKLGINSSIRPIIYNSCKMLKAKFSDNGGDISFLGCDLQYSDFENFTMTTHYSPNSNFTNATGIDDDTLFLYAKRTGEIWTYTGIDGQTKTVPAEIE